MPRAVHVLSAHARTDGAVQASPSPLHAVAALFWAVLSVVYTLCASLSPVPRADTRSFATLLSPRATNAALSAHRRSRPEQYTRQQPSRGTIAGFGNGTPFALVCGADALGEHQVPMAAG